MKNLKLALPVIAVCIAAALLLSACGGKPAVTPAASPAATVAASPGDSFDDSQPPAQGFVGTVTAIEGSSVTVSVLPIPMQQNGPTPSPGTKTVVIPDGMAIQSPGGGQPQNLKVSDLKAGNMIIVYYAADGETVEKVTLTGNQ